MRNEVNETMQFRWGRVFCSIGVEEKTTGANKSVLYGSLRRNESDGREPPQRDDLIAKAKQYLLLEAVTREQMVTTQQDGKDLAYAVMICILWRLEMAL
jgi:hypothetical protein